jgi:hypothetical protein
MQRQRFLIALAITHLASLGCQSARNRPAQADSAAAAPPAVLRVRALELVDDHGRVRAELKLLPADPNVKMPDGTTGYPETVILRLITSSGGPNVKLATTEDGAGLVLGGASGAGYVQILSRGQNDPFMKIVTKDGRERVVKP